MRKASTIALLVVAFASSASAGTVALELRWNGVPGCHDLLIMGSQTAWIELWATVSPGDTVATANIAWDIRESAPGDFEILDREIAAGWYDFVGDPSPMSSTNLHGYFTGEGAGNSTGTFMLERYAIHRFSDANASTISVVAANPLNPGQVTEVNSSTETHTVILPNDLRLLPGPEPSSVALLLLGGVAVLRRRRV